MGLYIFKINGEYKMVEAFDLYDALKEAGIDENDDYDVIEEDDFEDKCFMSAIIDDILYDE